MPREESDDRAASGAKFVVRLKVPDQYPSYDDLIYGKFKPLKKRRGENAYEDPILLKSDGLPTYHLANVVDDYHMKITHVIRGLEWMPSTPKHIAMYNAFGWEPPQFAHVGLLVDEQGNKLSKRNFDTDITAFKEMEIFPETLTNFAALLGWSHRESSDVMDLQQLIEKFTLKFTKGNTVVTFGKLHFLQRKHAALRAAKGGLGLKEMAQAVLKILQDPRGPYKEWTAPSGTTPEKYIKSVIRSDPDNYTNANEYIYRHSYLFAPPRLPASAKFPEDVVQRSKGLAEVKDWTKDNLMQKLHEIIDGRPEGKAGAKGVYHYLRMALTGREQGMRLYDIMLVLGRETTLTRLGAEL
jgi:glutamyl-tRNA synthetase